MCEVMNRSELNGQLKLDLKHEALELLQQEYGDLSRTKKCLVSKESNPEENKEMHVRVAYLCLWTTGDIEDRTLNMEQLWTNGPEAGGVF